MKMDVKVLSLLERRAQSPDESLPEIFRMSSHLVEQLSLKFVALVTIQHLN